MSESRKSAFPHSRSPKEKIPGTAWFRSKTENPTYPFLGVGNDKGMAGNGRECRIGSSITSRTTMPTCQEEADALKKAPKWDWFLIKQAVRRLFNV